MSRRDNAHRRCPRCRVHESVCLCALIPRIATRTRVLLVIHKYEDRKSTNTGRLATLCLENSEILIRGREDARNGEPPVHFPAGTQPLLLFPGEDATPLPEFLSLSRARPVTLVVPDGNWRQASKVGKRLQGLAGIPRVTLPPGPPSRYRLRSEPHPAGLATMEAIARALGLLEGTEVQRALERVFDAMVERTLWTRGDLAAEEVTGGIPEGAERHDPDSGLSRRRTPSERPRRGGTQAMPGGYPSE